MTRNELARAMREKRAVKYRGRKGYVIDHYEAPGGRTIAVVAKNQTGAFSGNNVPIDELTEDRG